MSGIELQENDKGEAIHVAIDLQEHPEVIPLLKEAGLMPKTKKELEAEFDNALLVDEVFDKLEQKIINHYANRRNSPTR